MMKKCLLCKTLLTGRIDKKFCNSYCKTAFHYQNNKEKEASFYQKVDKQLKTNRRILKEYNKSGKSVVRSATLIEEGFNPSFFTHTWQNQKGKVYRFCYEFGFLSIVDNHKTKFLLIQWQDYMAKK